MSRKYDNRTKWRYAPTIEIEARLSQWPELFVASFSGSYVPVEDWLRSCVERGEQGLWDDADDLDAQDDVSECEQGQVYV